MQINIAVLTITDTRTMENDKSGSIARMAWLTAALTPRMDTLPRLA